MGGSYSARNVNNKITFLYALTLSNLHIRTTLQTKCRPVCMRAILQYKKKPVCSTGKYKDQQQLRCESQTPYHCHTLIPRPSDAVIYPLVFTIPSDVAAPNSVIVLQISHQARRHRYSVGRLYCSIIY